MPYSIDGVNTRDGRGAISGLPRGIHARRIPSEPMGVEILLRQPL